MRPYLPVWRATTSPSKSNLLMHFSMPFLSLQREEKRHSTPTLPAPPLPIHLGGFHNSNTDFSAETCKKPRYHTLEFLFIPNGWMVSSPAISPPTYFAGFPLKKTYEIWLASASDTNVTKNATIKCSFE